MPLIPRAQSGRFHVEHLFRPESVAIIGAGTELGGTAMRNMLGAGFTGAVLPVGQGLGAVGGVFAYPDIASLPVAPSLGVIATEPDAVAGALAALAARGGSVVGRDRSGVSSSVSATAAAPPARFDRPSL